MRCLKLNLYHCYQCVGCTETVAALLAAGADTGIVNKIGKTAAQLGSFVGQHSCVQVINNYFSLSDLHSYTSQLKADGQPRLNSAIAPYLHSLLITTQVHPVHVSATASLAGDLQTLTDWSRFFPVGSLLALQPFPTGGTQRRFSCSG